MITSVTNYKIHIHDRNYSSWDIYDTGNLNKISTIEINPIECFPTDTLYLQVTHNQIFVVLYF